MYISNIYLPINLFFSKYTLFAPDAILLYTNIKERSVSFMVVYQHREICETYGLKSRAGCRPMRSAKSPVTFSRAPSRSPSTGGVPGISWYWLILSSRVSCKIFNIIVNLRLS